jgi:hypothetical protein
MCLVSPLASYYCQLRIAVTTGGLARGYRRVGLCFRAIIHPTPLPSTSLALLAASGLLLPSHINHVRQKTIGGTFARIEWID